MITLSRLKKTRTKREQVGKKNRTSFQYTKAHVTAMNFVLINKKNLKSSLKPRSKSIRACSNQHYSIFISIHYHMW